jgi:hypothetical protein
MKKLILTAMVSLVVMTGVAFGAETREPNNGQAPPAVRAERRRIHRIRRHRRHMRHMRRRMRREMRHGA